MPIELSRAKDLFLAALELPADERSVYLDSACGDDTALRLRVDAMLRTHENSGELLPRSPAEMLADSGSTETDATAAFAQHMEASATHVDSPGGEHDDLSFLTPSSQPGHLGRLGHYEIQEIIGKGGFGIVLKAFDERLHRVVAIKVLSPAYAANGSARKRFIREARTAAAVKNEHVVGIHDVQEDALPPYLVMEMIDGVSLQDKIDKHGPLGIKEILRIGTQMAEGLAAAHKQGLVHRDIKPANILLENGVERVKITDFGLARAVDDASVTQSGTVAGTPMYMSPEQAEGLPIDHRSDLFSLGTVLYAMGTGHPPFRASGTHAVLKRVIDASPRPIREINSEIPEWLEAIITKLHAKKPDDRFQTAREVAELLEQHLAHLQQPSMAPMPAAVFRTGEAEFAKPLEGAPSVWLPTLIGVVLGAVFASVVGFINPAELSVFGNDSPPWFGFLALAAMGAAIGTLAGFIRVLLFARIALAIRDAGKSVPAPPANGGTTPAKSTLEKLLEGSDTSRRLLQHGLLSVVLAFGTTGVLLIALNPALLWQGIGLVLAAVILGLGVARIKQRWTVAYRGHQIRFENSCMTGESLFIDNIRVARGGVGLRNEVRGVIQRGEGIGEEIVVLAESGLFSFHCRILVDRAPAPATTARLALASRIQRWLLAGSAAAVLMLLAAGVGTVLYLRTYPDFAVTLAMDDPDTVVRIWPTAQTEPPENLAGAVQILGTPKYVIQGRTMEDLLLPTGNYWLTAELGGREAHRVFLKVQADSFVTYHRSIVTYHREEEQRPGGKVVNWVSNITFGIPKAISIPAAANLRQQDVARLQGTWHAIAAERHGKALPKQLVDQMNFGLILINGMFIVHMQETAETERIDPKSRLFKISPNKKPAALDLIVPIDTAGGAKNSGKTLLCIYRFEGDTLHLCTSTRERPDDFTTKPGSERMLFVLKRFPGTDKKVEPSWVQLFNGKDLTGWEGLPKLWRVEGDSVIGSTRGNPVKHWTALSSRRPYKDFEIRFKAKLNGANSLSGLYIRGNLQDRIEYNLLGYNAHMGDASWASLFEGTVGAISAAPEETLNRILRRNDYNDMYVKCVGKHVTIRLNGVTTVDGDFPKMQDEGVIGWQIKPGDPMELTIKDVWLRELPPEEPGWVPLFNGKDLTGWNVGKEAGAWKVAADNLVSVSPKAVATTGRRFSQNFHLRTDVKPEGGRARITFRNGRSLDVSADKDEVCLTLRLPERESEFRAPFADAWNKWIPLDVIVDGGRVDVKLDGQNVLTKFELMPFENEKEWSGPIVLSTPHVGSELRLRKVEIKETGPFSALPLTTGK